MFFQNSENNEETVVTRPDSLSSKMGQKGVEIDIVCRKPNDSVHYIDETIRNIRADTYP